MIVAQPRLGLEEDVGEGRASGVQVLPFMRMLRGIEHKVRMISKGMQSSLGVTGSELLLLRMVGKHPGLSAGDLARLLHLSPSSLSGVIQRLVDRRLVERSTHAQDRRRDVLFLTAAGKRVDRQRAGTVEARFQRAFAKLSSSKLETAAVVLKTLDRELSLR